MLSLGHNELTHCSIKKTLCSDPIVIEHLQSKSRCVSITWFPRRQNPLRWDCQWAWWISLGQNLVNFTILWEWCINVCFITICEHIKYDMKNSFLISFHSWQTPTLHMLFNWANTWTNQWHSATLWGWGWGGHFAPKRVGVRGPWGELSPQPEYLRGEFYPQPEYQIFTKWPQKSG